MNLSGLLRIFHSLTIRVVVILTIGMASAAIISILITETARVKDFQHAELERLTLSITDIAHRYAASPAQTDLLIRGHQIFGFREAPDQWAMTDRDPPLETMLSAALGKGAGAQARHIQGPACYPTPNDGIKPAGMNEPANADCWFLRFVDNRGVERKLGFDTEPAHTVHTSAFDPIFLLLIVIASAGLSWLVARFVVVPLKRLTEAARTFSLTTPPHAIPEDGPNEVRLALQTFNIMQERVTEGFKERTQILASIAHDLQTPLTRLRLRVEQVDDDVLREQLVGDLAKTLQLVRDGLDLARSSESQEAWAVVDIDSALSSLSEDAQEFGQDVRFVAGCGAQAMVRPNALMRCLGNLVDNAVKYAGSAELSSVVDGDTLSIQVRDFGPGIASDQIDQAMRPFQRLNANDAGVPGTGLGLTIARLQAQTFGATLTLGNHPDGGLLSTLSFRLG